MKNIDLSIAMLIIAIVNIIVDSAPRQYEPLEWKAKNSASHSK